MSAPTPGQAAFETHELASSHQWGSGAYPWDRGNPTSQLIWELAFYAGVEAANGTYTRPEFRLDQCPLHPGRREVQIRRNGEWMCLQAAVAAAEPPPAPELAAATAVKAAPGDTVIIAPGRPLDQAEAHHIAGLFADIAPGVGVIIAPDVEAMRAWSPAAAPKELAAAMAESTKLRNWLDDFTHVVIDLGEARAVRAAERVRAKAGLPPVTP